MRKTRCAAVVLSALVGLASKGFSQCENVGFSGAAGSPANQGFTPVGSPQIEPLPDGTIRWTVLPGTAGLFAPPDPPWAGGVGTRQEVRCTLRVISSPMMVSPTGVHDAGFAVYRGRCIQGGNVVAGVTNEGVFISISTPQGVEEAFDFAPFDTRSEPAVYHFVATDHGQFFTVTRGSATARAICPTGRYSGVHGTWRVGGGGAAPAQVVVSDWTIARGLRPLVTASAPALTACNAQPIQASIFVSNQEGTSVRWQVRETDNPQQPWRDITDGPLFVGGRYWGSVSGTDTTTCIFVADTANNRAPFQHRAVATTECGTALSSPNTLRVLPDFDLNGRVDTADLLVLLGNFGSTVQPYCCGDVDGDGQGDVEDLVYVLGYFGEACS